MATVAARRSDDDENGTKVIEFPRKADTKPKQQPEAVATWPEDVLAELQRVLREK